MVYACIYDNIPDRGGYGIHARSAGFPVGFEQDVASVSGIFSSGDGYEESMAIRYAPLRNEKYLLTWVLRHPITYAEGQRAWHTEVHFLMDAKDADNLFRYPLSAVAERVSRKAHEMWKTMKCELDGELRLFAKDEHFGDHWDTNGKIDDCILLAGAFYCGQADGANQLFLESGDPWGEMNMVQRCLPNSLRKDLSFCVGLQSLQESKGTVFNFPTNIGLQQLHSTHGEGVPMSEKYWSWDPFENQKLYVDCDRILGMLSSCEESLLDLLFSVITDWKQLKALAGENLADGLHNVIMQTGQEVWCRQLRSKRYKNQELEWLLEQIRDNRDTRTLQKEIKRQLKKIDDDHTDELLLKQFLLNHAIRGAMVAAMVVALVVIITLFRQVLVQETVQIEQAVYYCISREAAVDAMKLIGAYLCGALSVWAVSELIKTFKRKK